MGPVTAIWVLPGPVLSALSSTMNLHSRIYHYTGALLAVSSLHSAFLSVWVLDTAFASQTEQCRRAMTQFRSHIATLLISMPLEVKLCPKLYNAQRLGYTYRSF